MSLPPNVPESSEDFRRVMTLLGVVAKGKDQLSKKSLRKLESFLGQLPRDIEQARAWMEGLKQLRDTLFVE